MNKMKNLATATALAITFCLASCNNQNEDPTPAGPAPVRFTASIGTPDAVATPVPRTRAAGTSWAVGDKIGIFMTAHATTNPAEADAVNRQYTTATGDGSFTPIMGQELYYPMDNSAVDFIAYYPYTATATLTEALPITVATTQTSASQTACDYLWASANNSGTGYDKSATAAVALPFSHSLARLTMNCIVDANVGTDTPADGIPSLPADAVVTINGMYTTGSFAPSTGQVSAAATPAAITPRRLDAPTDATKYAATFDAIILPATYTAAANVTVSFTIHDETYVWTVGKMEFKSGNDHIYEVTITRSGVKAIGTIKDWNQEIQGGVTAE